MNPPWADMYTCVYLLYTYTLIYTYVYTWSKHIAGWINGSFIIKITNYRNQKISFTYFDFLSFLQF